MEDLAEGAIEHALKLGAEFADLRLETTTGTNIIVMDGRTKHVVAQQDAGCGIRAFRGGAWGFSVTNSLTRTALRAAAERAVRMAVVAESKARTKFSIEPARSVRKTEVYSCRERPSDVRVEEKLSFALELDKSMESADKRIVSASTRYDDFEADRIVANSYGTLVRTREIWTLAACSAWAKSGSVVQRGHEAIGEVTGYELMRRDASADIGRTAAEQALRLLDSKPVPAGKFTCVFDNKMTGLLAHEAFGHACEADAILAGSSVLEGRIGEKVAHESVSLYDDPSVKGSFGYFSYDWEGVKAKKHALIEKGVLREYMHNIESGSRMGAHSNGAARAETYFDRPIIRMSNTFIGAGDWNKDELVEEAKRGLLIIGGQYGYVEPAKGQFMFKCDEAYAIENGEFGQRYRDASVSGLILEVLNNVVGIADDMELRDPGYCGKGSQSARTTDGGPHMCVSDMVVGGLT